MVGDRWERGENIATDTVWAETFCSDVSIVGQSIPNHTVVICRFYTTNELCFIRRLHIN
jgi:hypothetical protein